jgi:hypothetical protein
MPIPATPPPPSPPSPPPSKTPPETEHPGTTPPQIVLSHLSGRIGRAGFFTFRVACPSAEVLCKVNARLRASGIALGSSRLTLAGGESRSVRIRISRQGRSLLRRRGRLRARLIVTTVDASGNSKTVTANPTLSSR